MSLNAIDPKIAQEQMLSPASLAFQQVSGVAASFTEFLTQAGASLMIDTKPAGGAKADAETPRVPEAMPRQTSRRQERAAPPADAEGRPVTEDAADTGRASDSKAAAETKPAAPAREPAAKPSTDEVSAPAAASGAGSADAPVAEAPVVAAAAVAPVVAATAEVDVAVQTAPPTATTAAPAVPAAQQAADPKAADPGNGPSSKERPRAAVGPEEVSDGAEPTGEVEVKLAGASTKTPAHQGGTPAAGTAAADPAQSLAGSEAAAQQAAGLAKDAGADTRMRVKVRVTSEATPAATEATSEAAATATTVVEPSSSTKSGQQGNHGQGQNVRTPGLPDPAAAQAVQAQAGNAAAGAVQPPAGDKSAGLTTSQGLSGVNTSTAAGGTAAASAAQPGQNAETQQTARAASATPLRHAAFRHGVVDQVSVHITKAAAEGLDHIKIQLRPASLGRIDVEIEMSQDGRLTAVVTADNKDTLELLQRDSKTLEKALQDAGLQADSGSLTFNLRSGNGSSRNQGEADNAPAQRPVLAQEEKSLDELLSADVYATPRANGRIDIRA